MSAGLVPPEALLLALQMVDFHCALTWVFLSFLCPEALGVALPVTTQIGLGLTHKASF